MGHLANLKRRARKLNLLIKYNYKCLYCCKKLSYETATVDHIIPKSKGGGNAWDNLAICCLPCNQLKADKILKCQVLPKSKIKKPKKRKHDNRNRT